MVRYYACTTLNCTHTVLHTDVPSIKFCIAKCGHPELVSNDSVPKVVGYDDIIPVEGTTIWFSCPPGLVITGPNSATCMENGEWEPDPSGVTCNDSKVKISTNLYYCNRKNNNRSTLA